MEIVTIASSVLGSLGLGALLLEIFKDSFIHKIKLNIEADYNQKLEQIKHELNSNHSVLTTVLSSQKDGYHFANAERISAVKIYWKYFIGVVSDVYIITYLDSFISVTEFASMEKYPKAFETLKSWLGTYDNRDFVALNAKLMEIKETRPFLNDKLWSYISFLNGFMGRLHYLYIQGVGNKDLKHWTKDNYMQVMVQEILTEQEYQFLLSSDINTINPVLAFIEAKVLAEFSLITDGKAGADYSYKMSLEAIALTQNLNKQNPLN